MMTIEERDTARAIQSMNRKMKDETKIDWEQRRYEIAKDVLIGNLEYLSLRGTLMDETHAAVARAAVYFADALIEELKINPIK